MVQKKQSSTLLTVLIVVLFADLVLGIVYGYVSEPIKAAAAPQPGPAVQKDTPAQRPVPPPPPVNKDDAKADKPPVQSGPVDPATPAPANVLNGNGDTEKPKPEDEPVAALSPEDQKKLAELLNLKIEEKPRKTAAAPNTKGQPAKGTGDQGGTIVVPFADAPDNPENDLITAKRGADQAQKPANLSTNAKKGDELLEAAKELMRKWDSIRALKGRSAEARKLMKQAKETLDQARASYKKATDAPPADTYVKKQLDLANQLYYAAMKASSI